jgi:very-short-patch-repair endonuclease
MPVSRARELRNNMTPVERRLWLRLRGLRERGYHFRRQAPFRAYYLDFVCFDRRIVVEVDGGQHNDERQAEHDAVRDAILARAEFTVLRFWNSSVMTDIDGVMDQIVLALEDAPSAHADWKRSDRP